METVAGVRHDFCTDSDLCLFLMILLFCCFCYFSVSFGSRQMLHTSKTVARCVGIPPSLISIVAVPLIPVRYCGFIGFRGSVRVIPCGGCGLTRILLFSFLRSFKWLSICDLCPFPFLFFCRSHWDRMDALDRLPGWLSVLSGLGLKRPRDLCLPENLDGVRVFCQV